MTLETNVLKGLLGIEPSDSSQDAVISFMLENVEEIIRNHCNVTKIPDGLRYTAYRMAVDMYRNEQLGNAESQKPVSSISEGDTSVSFSGSQYEVSYTDSLLKKYEKQLNRFRRLVW